MVDNSDPINRGWRSAAQMADAGAGMASGVNDTLTNVGVQKLGSLVNSSLPASATTTSDILGTVSDVAGKVAPFVGPAVSAYDYAKTGLTNALTRDFGDWRNGAKTGASLGSVAGPLGTVVGGGMGAIAGLAGSQMGVGKTTNKGYTPTSGTYNQGGQMSSLGTGGVGAKRYGSYNDAMNYLNGVNQQWNPDWSSIGDSEQGRYDLSTKMANPAGTAIGAVLGAPLGPMGSLAGAAIGSAIGGKKKHNYVDSYNANLNTGYNVMDDFVNGRNYSGDTWNLDRGWEPYRQQQDAIFQDRLGNLSRANEASIVNGMRNNVNDLVTDTDQRQYDLAKNTLDQQLARGYMTQRQYQQALNQLNQNRIANRQSLSDIGSNQLDQWKSDVKQAYQNKMDQDLADAWIKNYNAWKADDLSGLYGGASDAAQAYLNNVVSDDYLKSLMMQTNMYTPEQYMATGVSNAIDDNLGRWYGNRQKRNAPLVYEGE